MRIGELAERAGVSVETVRYYERRGLLGEPPRTPNGHRRYHEEDVRFLRAVKEAQRLGFTLAEIEDVLARADRGGLTSEQARQRIGAKLAETEDRIADLQRVRSGLARALGCTCQALATCSCGAAELARRGRPPVLAGTLHVTSGDATAAKLRATGLPGPVLAWQDVLHEGPLADLPAAQFATLRAGFLTEAGWGSRGQLEADFTRRDAQLAEASEAGAEIVLWFEHDLHCQLQLVQILARLEPSPKVRLVVVGEVAGHPDFTGLGELSPQELEVLHAHRTELTGAELATARAAWRALCDGALGALLDDPAGTAALPFLGPALRRLLEDRQDGGLSRTERQLLEPLLDGPSTPVELFLASQRREEAPFLGDSWAWDRLWRLGLGERPLVRAQPPHPWTAPPPRGDPGFATVPVELTGHGRERLVRAGPSR